MGKEKNRLKKQKKRRFIARPRFITACVLTLTCAFAAPAAASIFRLEPSIMLVEEYDDNVFLQHKKKGSTITIVSPAVNLIYTTSFWDWSLAYTYYYFYYGSHGINNDSSHALALKNRTELLKDYIFLEVRDDYSRVSQNVAINYAALSPQANQADQNVLTVNPSVRLKPWQTGMLILGYIYQETRFLNASDSSAVSTVNVEHFDNIGYAELGQQLSTRITATAGARYTHEENDVLGFNQEDVYAGLTYRYAEYGSLTTRGGKSWFDFSHNQYGTRDFWFWDANLSQRFSTLAIGLATTRSVVQDPTRVVTRADSYSATLSKVGTRGSISVTGGLNYYRDMVLDKPIADSEIVSVSLLYRITPRISCTAGAAFQDVQNKVNALNQPTDTDTRVVFSNLRLSYQIAPKTSLAGEFRYVHQTSGDPLTPIYYGNQYLIEFKHTLW